MKKLKKKGQTINYKGTTLLFIAVSSLMILLTESGNKEILQSPVTLGLLSILIISLTLFYIHEKRVDTPVMPFELWRKRLIFIANITSLTTGMIIIGVSSYLPAFVQGVMGETATIAGFTLTMMSIGWPIASTIAGRLLLKIGYRKTSLLGGIALLTGSLFFYFF